MTSAIVENNATTRITQIDISIAERAAFLMVEKFKEQDRRIEELEQRCMTLEKRILYLEGENEREKTEG
jgi:hypothetical protein